MTTGAAVPTTSWRGLPASVRVLVIARAANRLGAFTLPFLAVVLTTELGATVGEAGLILTLFGLATIPSRLLGGYLADRIGRKATVLLGLIGCATAQLLIAMAAGLLWAVCAVGLLGLVFEVYEPPSQAIIADVTAPEDRPAAYGLLGAALAAAAVLAGLLAVVVGRWDLRWLFVLDAGSCLICALLLVITLPANRPQPRELTTPAGTSAWRDPRLLWMLGTGTVFATLYLQLMQTLPLTLIARGLPASSIGTVLTVSALTVVGGQPLLRVRRIRALDDFHVMTIGYAVLAAGLVANGLATNLPGFLLATVVWSTGDLLLLGRSYSIVAGLAPEDARGQYLATYGISWGIAGTLAPLAGTQLLSGAGPAGLWTACALAALALACLQPTLARRLRPTA